MNILLIIILIIILFFTIKGFARGIFGIFFGIASWIFVFAFVVIGSPQIEQRLLGDTNIYVTIQEKAEDFIMSKLEEGSLEDLMDGNLLLKEVQGVSTVPSGEMADIAVYTVRLAVANKLSHDVAAFAVRGLSYIIAVLAAEIICYIVKSIFTSLYHVKRSHGISRILGTCDGFVSGVLISDVILYAVYCFSVTELAQKCLVDIQASGFLTYLYTHNYFAMIIQNFYI